MRTTTTLMLTGTTMDGRAIATLTPLCGAARLTADAIGFVM